MTDAARPYSALILVACALAAACSEQPTQPEIVIPAAGEPIVFSRHVEPIFGRSCARAGCHAGAAEAARGMSLESWDNAMAGSSSGAMVVPFAARKSHLLQHIATDTSVAPMASPHMPLDGSSLPREQILLIKRWIAEGARNDAGEVALSGDRSRVLVASQGEDLVSAIDLQTLRVARYIAVGRLPDSTAPPEAPHNIALAPDGRHFFVNLLATGEIEKYDAVTFAKLGSAQVGRSPAQIAVTRDGGTLYVSNFDRTFTERFVSRVDANAMGVSTPIETGGRAPHGITLSPDDRLLYTANAGSDDVSVIDLATDEVIRIIPIVPGSPLPPDAAARHEPYQSVLSRDGSTLFVSCRASAQVRAIGLVSGAVVDSIPVGSRPLVLEISPDGNELWVPNQGNESVSIVDVASRSVVSTMTGFETQPHAVAFTRDGRFAFVACENQNGSAHHPVEGMKAPGLVYVVDTSTRQIVRSIEVGAFAAGLVVRE